MVLNQSFKESVMYKISLYKKTPQMGLFFIYGGLGRTRTHDQSVMSAPL